MQLTDQEIQTATRWIGDMGKAGKARRVSLWIGLPGMGILFVIGIYQFHVGNTDMIQVLRSEPLYELKSATQPVDASDLQMLRANMKMDAVMLLLTGEIYLLGVLNMSIASYQMVRILITGRDSRRQMLMAKLLRGYLEDKQLIPPQAL